MTRSENSTNDTVTIIESILSQDESSQLDELRREYILSNISDSFEIIREGVEDRRLQYRENKQHDALIELELQITEMLADALDKRDSGDYTEAFSIQADAKELRDNYEYNDTFVTDNVTNHFSSMLDGMLDNFSSRDRHEMMDVIGRMGDTINDIQTSTSDEKEFLIHQYNSTREHMVKEYEEKNNAIARLQEGMTHSATRYLDFQSLYSGFVDNNPVMMGLYNITSTAIKDYRTSQKLKSERGLNDKRMLQRAERIKEQDNIRNDYESLRDIDISRQRTTNDELNQRVNGTFNRVPVTNRYGIYGERLRNHLVNSMDSDFVGDYDVLGGGISNNNDNNSNDISSQSNNTTATGSGLNSSVNTNNSNAVNNNQNSTSNNSNASNNGTDLNSSTNINSSTSNSNQNSTSNSSNTSNSNQNSTSNNNSSSSNSSNTSNNGTELNSSNNNSSSPNSSNASNSNQNSTSNSPNTSNNGTELNSVSTNTNSSFNGGSGDTLLNDITSVLESNGINNSLVTDDDYDATTELYNAITESHNIINRLEDVSIDELDYAQLDIEYDKLDRLESDLNQLMVQINDDIHTIDSEVDSLTITRDRSDGDSNEPVPVIRILSARDRVNQDIEREQLAESTDYQSEINESLNNIESSVENTENSPTDDNDGESLLEAIASGRIFISLARGLSSLIPAIGGTLALAVTSAPVLTGIAVLGTALVASYIGSSIYENMGDDTQESVSNAVGYTVDSVLSFFGSDEAQARIELNKAGSEVTSNYTTNKGTTNNLKAATNTTTNAINTSTSGDNLNTNSTHNKTVTNSTTKSINSSTTKTNNENVSNDNKIDKLSTNTTTTASNSSTVSTGIVHKLTDTTNNNPIATNTTTNSINSSTANLINGSSSGLNETNNQTNKLMNVDNPINSTAGNTTNYKGVSNSTGNTSTNQNNITSSTLNNRRSVITRNKGAGGTTIVDKVIVRADSVIIKPPTGFTGDTANLIDDSSAMVNNVNIEADDLTISNSLSPKLNNGVSNNTTLGNLSSATVKYFNGVDSNSTNNSNSKSTNNNKKDVNNITKNMNEVRKSKRMKSTGSTTINNSNNSGVMVRAGDESNLVNLVTKSIADMSEFITDNNQMVMSSTGMLLNSSGQVINQSASDDNKTLIVQVKDMESTVIIGGMGGMGSMGSIGGMVSTPTQSINSSNSASSNHTLTTTSLRTDHINSVSSTKNKIDTMNRELSSVQSITPSRGTQQAKVGTPNEGSETGITGGKSARNSESSISRVTDRMVSYGF